MIEVGNLRIRSKDSSIWAPVMGTKENSNYLFYCPFDQATGIHNKINNGYDFNFCYESKSSTETGEYVGSTLGCNNIYIDLSKDWNVIFEYIYTGKNEQLATDWNVIFGFGRHINDIAGSVDDLHFSLPINKFIGTTNRGQTWCNTTNVQTWHRYTIEHKENVTTVTIDNVPQETAQFTYPNTVQGFYLSGGGYRHALQCKIKNFSLFGTLSE